MATSSRDVKLSLGVEVNGADGVGRLAGDLHGVAAAGTAAAPSLGKMAAELATLEAHTKELRAAESAALAEVKQQRAARDDQRDALARLRAETDKATRGTAEHQAKERELRIAIIESGRAIRDKAATLDAATTSARIAAATERTLAEQIAAAHRQAATAATDNATKQRAANTTVGDSLVTLGGQIRTVQNLAAAAIGGQMLGGLVGDVSKTADAYANLGARIKLAAGEGAAFNTAFAGVFDVATRTNSAVEQTGALFTKLAEAGKAIGLGTADALRLTESINQAVQISGASAESSNAAIVQLVQGLQSGVLRGEELASVLEQAPRLAKALADGLGTTTGELRKMGEAGQLTSQTVINALQGQSTALQREFDQLPATVGKALQNVTTAWTRYLGEADKAHGVSKAAAAALNALAGNLDTLGTLLYSAGKAAAAYQALKLAETFLGIGTAARVATAEVVALNAAQTAAAGSGATAAAGAGRFAAALATIKLGALALVVTNLKEISTAMGEWAARMMGAKDRSAELEAQIKAEEAATRAAAAAKAELAQKTQLASDTALGLNDISRKAVGLFEEMRAKGESVGDALEKVAKSLELGDLAGIANAGAALDALAVKGKISAADIQTAYSAALKGVDLAAFETQARAAFDNSAQGARRLAQVMDATLREAVHRTGLDFDVISGGMGKASRLAINDTDAIIKGLDRLKAQGVDTAQALTASLGKGINTADSQKALDAVRLQIEAVRKVLGDKVADGLLDQAKQKAQELGDALDKAKPGINSLSEAMKELGVVSDKTLKDTAEKSKQAFDAMKTTGTASIRELADGFKKYAADAIAANGGVASESLKVEAAVRGVTIAVDDNGKATVANAEKSKKAIEEVARAYIPWGEAAEKAAERELAAREKVIAAREKEIGLMERAEALENKRLNRDKEGYSLNTAGQRVAMQGESERSLFESAKSQGLSEAQALQIARQFIQNGEKVGGPDDRAARQGATWSTQVQKAIDKLVLDNADKNVAAGQSAAKSLNPPFAPGQSPTNTVNVRLILPDNTVKNVPTTQEGSYALIAALKSAKLSAGY